MNEGKCGKYDWIGPDVRKAKGPVTGLLLQSGLSRPQISLKSAKINSFMIISALYSSFFSSSSLVFNNYVNAGSKVN